MTSPLPSVLDRAMQEQNYTAILGLSVTDGNITGKVTAVTHRMTYRASGSVEDDTLCLVEYELWPRDVRQQWMDVKQLTVRPARAAA